MRESTGASLDIGEVNRAYAPQSHGLRTNLAKQAQSNVRLYCSQCHRPRGLFRLPFRKSGLV